MGERIKRVELMGWGKKTWVLPISFLIYFFFIFFYLTGKAKAADTSKAKHWINSPFPIGRPVSAISSMQNSYLENKSHNSECLLFLLCLQLSSLSNMATQSLWAITGISCPGCVPSQLLLHPQPTSEKQEPRGWALLSNTWNIPVLPKTSAKPGIWKRLIFKLWRTHGFLILYCLNKKIKKYAKPHTWSTVG